METFISDLKASVAEAKKSPEGKGSMVALYGTSVDCLLFGFSFMRDRRRWVGLGSSSAVGPTIVEEVASLFLDALYKA